MAELGQLKKRLRSVRLSGQLAGAMKTAASAKYAKANRLYSTYRVRSDALEALANGAFAQQEVGNVRNDDCRRCYVILGHNKGLCGSFNADLHTYAEEFLRSAEAGSVYICGKCAIAYFVEKKRNMAGSFILPDVPSIEDCRAFLDTFIGGLIDGSTDSVTILYQSFVNTLTQTPAQKTLRPFASADEADRNGAEEPMLWIPDRVSVMQELQRKLYETVFYRLILESSLGAQAATLAAMRTAYDNADETAERLENEINKKRQGAVTMGVLETSAVMASEWEEDEDGGRK